MTGLFLLAVVGIAVVLIAGALRPDRMQVSRTTTIAAPAARVLALIEDLHQWALWSPFEKLDPQMKKTFAGAERGVGARYAWSGNGKAGQGSMVVTAVEAQPDA